MIEKPNNWNEVKEISERPKIPVGAYVCKVKTAAIQSNDYGKQLCVLFDIFEGEWRNFYTEEFEENTSENKKYKGVLRIWLPKNDGTEKDEWTKSRLKTTISAFEKSNPGFMFNWDEESLAGKMIGILYRNEEWEYEGKSGWAARPYIAMTVDRVREGDYRLPKEKPLRNKSDASYSDSYSSGFAAPSDFSTMEGDSEELPF